MRHFVNLRAGDCCLMPELRQDADSIVDLWNQPHVLGNLFTIKTTRDVFLAHYETYEHDNQRMNWVIRGPGEVFEGTIGISAITAHDCKIGRFAMRQGSTVMVALPQTLVKSFVFDVLQLKRIWFDVISTNLRIKKFHRIMGATFTGEVEKKVVSRGGTVDLEHWYYDRCGWNFDQEAALAGL